MRSSILNMIRKSIFKEWEAVDISCLETRKLKIDRYKYIAYVAMDIEFEDIQQ